MNDNVQRKSERKTKGIPPTRFGFENYGLENRALEVLNDGVDDPAPEDGAYGGIHLPSNENTMIPVPKAQNRSLSQAKSIVSRTSRRSSVREMEHLKRTMEREAELHEIEMQKLTKMQEIELLKFEKRQQFVLRNQQLEKELKKQQDLLSNVDDNDENDIPDPDNEERKKIVNEWVNNVDNDFRNGNKENQPNNYHPPIFGSTRQNQFENSIHNDVLIAALKALQTKEVNDLPTFNGEVVLEWPTFISEFRRSTKEFNISPSKNLRRLNKALTGKAKTSVETLLTSPDNIEQIISHLEMSFGRREWILEHLMFELRNLPVMKEENIHQFKMFYSKLFGAVTTIKNIGATNYLDNPDLLLNLEDKLPPTTKNYWIHFKAELLRRRAEVNIEALGDWFKFELDAQFAGLSQKDILKKSNKATVLAIGSPSSKKDKWCYKCKGAVGHYLRDCDEFRKLPSDQRRDFVKNNNICFMCLRMGHQTKDCRKKATLPKCSKCKKGHDDLLHLDGGEGNVENPVEGVHCIQTSDVLLKIAMVILKGPSRSMVIPAFFDDGSTATMIDEDLANELGLEGNISPITYRWTNEIVRTDNESRMVNVNVSSNNKNAKFYRLENVRTGKNLALPSQNFNVKDVLQLHPYLDEEKLRKICNVQPLLLIGSNNAGLTVSLKTIQFRLNGLLECKSRLGWTIHGPIYENTSKSPSISVHLMAQTADENLNELVKRTYEIDNFGVTNENEKLSPDDEAALSIMQSTMKKVGDRFEIGHLYKYPGRKFPTEESKRMALKRLYLMEKKMDRNEKFANEYIQRIEDYVQKDYAEKLSGQDLVESWNTYYLPHFDAYHPNKPGKFRWVMDAKAKAGEYSLNDLLLQGPDFVPPMLAVLWRARMKPIGINADIAEMFHQVRIRHEDRNSQRFLFRGKDRNREPDVYRMKVMMFGAISSPSCAQLVKNENAKTHEHQFPGVERAIIKQHYVDDYVDSTDTVEEAIALASNVIAVHENGGFRLVKWISNSTEFMESIPEDMRLPDYNKIEMVRMLGLQWNIKTDELVFKLDFKKFDKEFLSGEVVPTKREILRFLMSIYDPLGLLSPLVVKLRILFQEFWRLGIDWNEQAPNDIFEEWKKWLIESKSVQQVNIPRCYLPTVCDYVNVQLHTFTDAGEKAYCAMTFIRTEINGRIYMSLVQAKSRVAPIKPLTIPRLECQAAVTGSQITNKIKKELGIPIDRQYYWTDSTIVLGWINTTKKLGSFIGSRVSKILDSSQKDEWFWIPKHLNIADLATKTTNEVDLTTTSTWFNGPDFLYLPESEWPTFDPPEPKQSEILLFIQELEPVEERITTIKLENQGKSLPEINRFSKYNRLVRATAYALKMVKNLTMPKNERPKKLSIDVHDVNRAETLWHKKVQFECYAQELHDLKSKGFVKKSSRLYQLSPFVNDDEVICMRSRIPGVHPIILPQNHQFTNLLVQWYHESNVHQGVDNVINHLREKFWIPTCRTVVRKVFKSCMLCRVKNPKVKLVEMGDIPKERSEKCEFPFTFTGVDYFGPIMVRFGRRYEKVWGGLFTCLTTRAIHVEVVWSLNTSSAIMALTRFINLRGVPKKMFSDNGTSFVGADNDLIEFIKNLDNESIQNKLSIRGIEWIFNCPAAPNRGGAWERLIRCVKEGLKVLIETEFTSYEILATAISEIVNTVNNRPLTYISSDAADFHITAITPNDIILLRANHSQYDTKINYKFNPREIWKFAHEIADKFWHRWIKEYRPLLLKRTKWYDNRDDPQLKEGDLVRIVDENEISGRFLKGIISIVFPDKKGVVRTVKVDTIQGNTRRSYTRPITKIAKINIGEGLEDVIEESLDEE